jgi:hypothetical protein
MLGLNSLYKYTKHWFGPNGEIQMPEYQCNFCGQKATRPYPVEHLSNCEGIKALNATLEAKYEN